MERRDERVADETRLVPGLESYDRGEVAPLEPQPVADPYKQEPLFSKKVMIGWGLATIIVWFALTVVVPAVVDSIKTAVATSVQEAERRPGGETVIRTKRGVITIKRTPTGIVIDRQDAGTAAPAPAPTVEPQPAIPPVEPEPAPAPPPEATGKK